MTFNPDMIPHTPPATRTCEECGYVGTTRDIHAEPKEGIGNRFVCCTCLGHEKESCWKDRFPITEKEEKKKREIEQFDMLW